MRRARRSSAASAEGNRPRPTPGCRTRVCPLLDGEAVEEPGTTSSARRHDRRPVVLFWSAIRDIEDRRLHNAAPRQSAHPRTRFPRKPNGERIRGRYRDRRGWRGRVTEDATKPGTRRRLTRSSRNKNRRAGNRLPHWVYSRPRRTDRATWSTSRHARSQVNAERGWLAGVSGSDIIGQWAVAILLVVPHAGWRCRRETSVDVFLLDLICGIFTRDGRFADDGDATPLPASSSSWRSMRDTTVSISSRPAASAKGRTRCSRCAA